MKQFYILIAIIFITSLGFGQTTLYTQDFETDLDGYSHTPSQTPSTDPGDQYFYRAEPSDTSIYEGSVGPYTNVTGLWLFVGSNPKTINSANSGILSFDSIDVTGYTNFEFSADFGGVPSDWDASDDLRAEYSWDNTNWNLLYNFKSPDTNNPLELNNNASGGTNTANGSVLTYALQTITSTNFTGSGNTLFIRIVCDSAANYEAFGVDNIVLTGTIASSDTSVQFVSTSASVSEGVGTYDLVIEIANEDATNATDIEVALTSGDAADINTYTTQTVTFPAGSATDETVTLTITDDTVFEGDETLTFTLQNVSGGNNAQIGTHNTFDLTITENDLAPPITLPYNEDFSDCGTAQWTPYDQAGDDGDVWNCSGGEYIINGFGGSVDDIDWLISDFRVDFDATSVYIDVTTQERFGDTTNSTGEFEFLYSTDYAGSGDPTTATWTALTFDPNNTSSGSTPSAASTYTIDASGVIGTGYIAFKYDMTGVSAEEWRITEISIIDGLPTSVQFSSTSASVSESDGTYDLVLEITNEDATATTVEVALTSGDAADINSYTTQTVTFPSGSAVYQSVTLTITDDTVFEGDETSTFTIQNVSGGNSASIGANSTLDLTITDNESDPYTTIAIQDFDTTTPEWAYSNDVAFFDNAWGSDGYYGLIDISSASPINYSGMSNNILGENDLDDEGNGTTGFATTTLADVDISLYNDVVLFFDWEVIGYNANNDDAIYEVFYDGIGQGEVYLLDGDSSSSTNDGEGSISLNIPNSVNSVGLIVKVRNNGGSGYSGFDNFMVKGILPTVVFNGNGNSGFGAPVGGGNLSISADDTTVSCTFIKGAGDFNDTMVMYISTGASGRNVINGDVNDTNDANRRAISNTGSGDLTLPSGFEATHAIAINTGFGGLWSIPATGSVGPGGLTYIDAVGSPSAATDASFVYNFDWADLGFTEPTSFDFVVTYGNPNDGGSNMFSSDEAIGGIAAFSGNPGLGAFNFFSYYEYSSGNIGGSATTSGLSNIWSDPATWANGNVPFSSDQVDLNHDVTVDIDAEAASVDVIGNQLTIDTGKSLAIQGDLATISGGSIALNSSSSSYASLIVNGSAFVGLNVSYNRYVNEIGTGTTGGNDIISAPVVGQEFGAFDTANSSLAASGTIRAFAPFDNTTGVYENYNTVDNVNTELASGIGYRAASSTTGGSTLKFSGGINTSSVPVNISVGTHPTYGGWNLIGNPYPSYLSFKAFFDAVADVDYTIPETPAVGPGSLFDDTYDAVYGYNSDTSIWTIWDLNNLSYDSDKIAPGQGFFVKSKVGGGTVTFTNAMRSIGNSDDFIANKTTTSNVAKSTIKLTTSTKAFNTNLYFREGNTRGLDRGYDTAAFIGSAEGIFSNLVDDNSGEELYNQSLPYSDLIDVIVPLGIRASAGEQISISLDATATTMPSNINVYLEDTVANTFTLLNDEDYTLTPSATLNGTGRYFVRFQSEALSINYESLSGLQIYTPKDSKTLVVKGNLQSDTQISVFDIQGRVMLQSSLDTSTLTNTISTEQLNTGVYVVQLTNATQRKTQKVIIN